MKNPPERADFFVLKTLKPPRFGVSQMGEVAEQSEVGGGRALVAPLSRCATAACGRPRRSSDSPLDCHSLLRLRFAYPHAYAQGSLGRSRNGCIYENPPELLPGVKMLVHSSCAAMAAWSFLFMLRRMGMASAMVSTSASAWTEPTP